MAATAMLVLRPFTGLASSAAIKQGAGNTNNKLVLLHKPSKPGHSSYADRKVTSIASRHKNVVLLEQTNNTFSEKDYTITQKGNIRTGIISITSPDGIEHTSELAAYLKKTKNCQVVVCMSELGYKTKTGADDRTLAEKSSDIDIIISNHATNYSAFAVTTLNKKREEVIIHSANDNGFGLGSIEIQFDEQTGTKRFVAINHLLNRLPQSA